MRLVPLLHVEPADDGIGRVAAREPHHAVLVELQMMRREAEVDRRRLLLRRIVDLELTPRDLHREHLRGRMIGALPAPRRRRVRTNARRQPDAALLVHPRIVDVGVAVPDRFRAPIGRLGELRQVLRRRRLGVAPFGLDQAGLVVDGIEPRDEVRARFGRSVDQTVRIDGRIAAVGRDLVMQIALRRVPVPQRDDEVALDAGRTRRLRERQLALRDAIRPIAEIASARGRCRNCRCR